MRKLPWSTPFADLSAICIDAIAINHEEAGLAVTIVDISPGDQANRRKWRLRFVGPLGHKISSESSFDWAKWHALPGDSRSTCLVEGSSWREEFWNDEATTHYAINTASFHIEVLASDVNIEEQR